MEGAGSMGKERGKERETLTCQSKAGRGFEFFPKCSEPREANSPLLGGDPGQNGSSVTANALLQGRAPLGKRQKSSQKAFSALANQLRNQ